MLFPSRILVFLLILQIYFCTSECPQVFGQYRFDTWTTDDGLPQNGLREITQTPDGYLWFTTFDGLVRFDGVRFTSFGKGNTKGIINNRFTGLYGDRNGTLYATTMEDGILTVYRNGVFSSYTSEQVPGHYVYRIEPDANGDLRFLVEDEDRTSKSWYYLRDEKFIFSEKEESNFEKTTFQGKSGAIWTFTPTEAVERRSGKTTVYPLEMKKVNFRVNIFEDSAGNLWLGGNSVHRLSNGEVQNFGEKEGLPQSIYHSFWEESDGSVWFASGGASSPSVGLLQYKDGRLQIWGTESGLPATSIFSVFRDREGTVWLATNKGLSRLRKKVVSGFGTRDGINHSEVYPLYRDRQENIWIGTTKGLSIYRSSGKFEELELKPADKNAPAEETWRKEKMSVQSLWEDSGGKMWVGLNGGIYIVQNGMASMLERSRGHHVFAIREDKNGNVWAATNKGILQYRDYKFIRTLTVKDGLPNEFMTLIFEDSKENLWFGGFGGLSEFKDGKFINYTIKQGLAGSYVRSMYEDKDGTFWIGTYDEGLSRFKDGRFVNYRAENGLYSNGVFAIEEDARGNFWISSNRGIYRVKRQELNDFADGKIDKINSVGYGKEDGMLTNECNGGRQPSSIRDKDGRFWFPTQEGVAVIDAEAETDNRLPPPVVIESATVEREPVDISKNGLTIEPGQKNIEINFTGISLIKSKQIKFKYKLEGHDADWIDADTRRTAYYSYLPPGNYRFLVKAANSDGIWNEQGTSLNLELKPFFYQTDRFYMLCVLVAALGLFAVWKISVYQLEARERKLARLVDEKTEELRKANEELQLLANSDGLTAVGNRRLFEDFLKDEWHRAIRFKTEISLVLLDIDHFKLFNDSYGHQAGDECLKKVAAALRETIHRPTDLLARFGGEEFAIILGGTDLEGALNIAEQAMKNVKNLAVPHCKSLTSEHLTISVGVATTFVAFGMSESELIKAADEALYQAKATGRNRIVSKDLTLAFSENFVLDEVLTGGD